MFNYNTLSKLTQNLAFLADDVLLLHNKHTTSRPPLCHHANNIIEQKVWYQTGLTWSITVVGDCVCMCVLVFFISYERGIIPIGCAISRTASRSPENKTCVDREDFTYISALIYLYFVARDQTHITSIECVQHMRAEYMWYVQCAWTQ